MKMYLVGRTEYFTFITDLIDFTFTMTFHPFSNCAYYYPDCLRRSINNNNGAKSCENVDQDGRNIIDDNVSTCYYPGFIVPFIIPSFVGTTQPTSSKLMGGSGREAETAPAVDISTNTSSRARSAPDTVQVRAGSQKSSLP